MAHSADLFGWTKPTKPRRVMMHVKDAGMNGITKVIQFQCPKCGYNNGYLEDVCSIDENKRGKPCPNCNR